MSNDKAVFPLFVFIIGSEAPFRLPYSPTLLSRSSIITTSTTSPSPLFTTIHHYDFHPLTRNSQNPHSTPSSGLSNFSMAPSPSPLCTMTLIRRKPPMTLWLSCSSTLSSYRALLRLQLLCLFLILLHLDFQLLSLLSIYEFPSHTRQQ